MHLKFMTEIKSGFRYSCVTGVNLCRTEIFFFWINVDVLHLSNPTGI